MQEFNKFDKDGQDKLNENFKELHQKEKTYAELATLILDKKLVPGTQYVLTDYKTKYVQPDTNVLKEMGVERLVLTAISVDKFDITCSSLDYPQDVINYGFELNKCEDELTPRTGFILRRRDQSPGVNIDVPLDWRTMVWARWNINPTQYLVGTTLTNYAVWTAGAPDLNLIYIVGTSLYQAISTNVPTSNTDTNVFSKVWDLSDVVINDIIIGKRIDGPVLTLPKIGSPIDTPTFGTGCSVITFAETNHGKYGVDYYLHNNTFGNNCGSITFGSGCIKNTFGSSCASITFGSSCTKNTFGNNCGSITFGSYCFDNIFASACFAITFKTHGMTNTFDSNCCYIGADNEFHHNILGARCSSITFASSCYNNLFGAKCYNNTFGCTFNNNIAGHYFNSNTFGSSCYANIFGSNCSWSDYTNMSNCIFGNNKTNLHVSYFASKNISTVSALENNQYPIYIIRRIDGVFVYWYLNASNVPVYTTIA